MKNNSLFSIIFMAFISFIIPVSLFSMEGPYERVSGSIKRPAEEQEDEKIQAFLKALAEDEQRVGTNQPYQASKVFQLPRSITRNLPATLTSQFNKFNELYNNAFFQKKLAPFAKKVAELRTLAQGAPKKIEEKKEEAPKPIPTPKIVPIRHISKPKVSTKTIKGLNTMLIEYEKDRARFLNHFPPEALTEALKAIEAYQQTYQDKDAYQDFATDITTHLKTKNPAIPHALVPQLIKGKPKAEIQALQNQLDAEFPIFIADADSFFAARTSTEDIKKLQTILPLIKAAQAKDKDAYQDFAQAIEQHLKKYPPVKEGKEEIAETRGKIEHHKHTQWPGMGTQSIAIWNKAIKETQDTFDTNEQQLNNPETRFLPLSDALNKPNIFNIRSIQQMNGWLCGHLVLFNAYVIDQHSNAVKNMPLNKDLITNTLIPRKEYNWPKFKEFYATITFYGYSEGEQKQSTIDPFTGLKSPASLGSFGSGFLSDEQILERADLSLQSNLYILGMSGNDIFTLQNKGGLISLQNRYNLSKADIKELLAPNIAASKQNTPYLIHFVCKLLADHWILVSVINTGSAHNGRGLLIMDSQNTPLGKEDAGKADIITLIAKSFGFIQ